ncbi:MFS transporter [Lentibacillus sp. Marseille-P4043]|uniref:MFS transporter n=1 Tax=Lentibacillus sp. Marseille-P4043 TaxID=2040293 RepID=UPI000D0BCE5C|nr:MFS transporter [Lentibacillus sp. Marseille-P4043]
MNNDQTKINLSFIILLIGVFMAALDNGIISAALTTINSSFHVSATIGSWGITLYTLGLAVTTPIVGKLADRFGRKKLFLIEIAIFTIGSLGVALSPNYTFFLASRLFQSFGGGGIFIIASSHVISTFVKNRQGSMLGLLGAMNGIASVIGPNIGSFLIDWTGSWHWLFLINVPIGIILLVFGWTSLQETKETVMSKIDFLGITLLSLSILSVMFAVNNLGTGNLLDSFLGWGVLGLLLLGVAIFSILLLLEKKREQGNVDPILPYSMLRKPTYSMTMIMALMSGTFIGSVIFIPSFAEQILNISAAKSGYWMTPLALASGIGASGGGYFVDKRGPVNTIIFAGIVSFIGFGGLAFFTDTKLTFILFTVIAGIGFGFVLGAPLTVLTSNAAGAQKGTAIGTLSVARQIGLTIAPTIFASFIQQGFSKLGTLIPKNLSEHHIDASNIPDEAMKQIQSGGYSNIESKINQIPVPEVREALHDAFSEAAHAAYQPIYLFVAVMSLLMIIIALSFRKQFNKDSQENE